MQKQAKPDDNILFYFITMICSRFRLPLRSGADPETQTCTLKHVGGGTHIDTQAIHTFMQTHAHSGAL